MKKKKSQDELDDDIKKLKHYVDNVKFNQEMTLWKKAIREAEDCDEKKPPVTEYIATCFLKIAEHLSYRPNFMNYPYRDDMVGDGIENCLSYAHNFDPEKSNNPFSYFTQIIYYAFLRRIEKEKKQAFIKYKCLDIHDLDGKFSDWLRENQEASTYAEFLQKNFFLSETDIEKLEPKERKKRKKRKKKNEDIFD